MNSYSKFFVIQAWSDLCFHGKPNVVSERISMFIIDEKCNTFKDMGASVILL